MAELFGFSITRLKKQTDPKQEFTLKQMMVHKLSLVVILVSILIWKVLQRLNRFNYVDIEK